MTAEPSSRTRLYASRQASLSILVAITAEPQGDTLPRQTERVPGRLQGLERRRGAQEAGGRRRRAAAAAAAIATRSGELRTPGAAAGAKVTESAPGLGPRRPAPPPGRPAQVPYDHWRPRPRTPRPPMFIGRWASGAGHLYSLVANPSPGGLRNSSVGAEEGAFSSSLSVLLLLSLPLFPSF